MKKLAFALAASGALALGVPSTPAAAAIESGKYDGGQASLAIVTHASTDVCGVGAGAAASDPSDTCKVTALPAVTWVPGVGSCASTLPPGARLATSTR